MVVVWFSGANFVCSYFVALGETFKAKTWEKICRGSYFQINAPESLNCVSPLHGLHQEEGR